MLPIKALTTKSSASNVMPGTKTCVSCKKEFQPRANRQSYCTELCKFKPAICEVCGKEFLTKGEKYNVSGRFCSKRCWYDAPGKRKFEDRLCVICLKSYAPGKADQKYCSFPCAGLGKHRFDKNKQCLNCGKAMPWRIGSNLRKYCSRECSLAPGSREIVRRSAGSRRVEATSYVVVKTEQGWMHEHRYVMGKKLGRKLLRTEHVHHIDGNKSNNDISNLEVWVLSSSVKKHPAGVRSTDLHCEDCLCGLGKRQKKLVKRFIEELKKK